MSVTELLDRAWKSLMVVGAASGLLMLMLIAGSPAQPQPRIDELAMSPDWIFVEFDNGAQWYIRSTAIQAVHAIPKAQAEQLDYKVKIYGTSFTVNVPYDMEELEKRMVIDKAKFILDRIERRNLGNGENKK